MNPSNRSEIARIATLTAMVLMLAVAGVGAVQFVDSAAALSSSNSDVDAYAPDNTIESGTTSTLSVQFANDGSIEHGAPANRDRVTMVRNVVIEEYDTNGAPVTVETGTQSIGSISENKPVSVPIEIDVPENAAPGTYEMELKIRFTTTDQLGQEEQELNRLEYETVTFEISDDPQFELTRADDTQLRADETSLFPVTVENTGGKAAEDVAVSLSSQSPEIRFGSGTGAVSRIDSLKPGETTEVTYEVTVGSGAPARLYNLNAHATYTDKQGIDGRDEDLSVGARVGPQRNDFNVAVEDSTVAVGSTRLVAVTVTNNRDQRLSDIQASLGTSAPLDSDDDDGYIASLDPGESATVTFGLSATTDANPKTYAAALDFSYEDERGISRMSETYQLPVNVETDDGMQLGSISPLVIVVLLAAAAAIYGAAVYARQRPEILPWS